MINFPKNLLKIADKKAFKDYCLNPKGIKVKIFVFYIINRQIKSTSNFEKERKVESFLNWEFPLWRVEKPLDKNTIVFRCNPKLTKPEIRQYLEKSIIFLIKNRKKYF